MRIARSHPGLLLLALTAASPTLSAPPESANYHLVLSRRVVGAGEHVEVKLVPPAPRDARVRLAVTYGNVSAGLPETGVYVAPYLIPVGAPRVQISASVTGPDFRTAVSTLVELGPGSVPGAEDCLGPGQEFSLVMGDFEPKYSFLDELPELVHRVAPDYPRSAMARGIEDTLLVLALVCRNGRVLDAHTTLSSLVPGGDPIEPDPKLVEAALAAVRQYVFKPGLVSGQPVACWVATPVAFSR